MTKMNVTKLPVLTHLSYSAIKVYLESPEDFKYQYLEGNKPERSSAMTLGSVVDCLVTEPDKFNDLFAVRKMDAPSSEQQKGFINEIVDTYLAGVTPLADEIWRKHYKAGNKSEEAVLEAAETLFKTWKPYMEYTIDVKKNNKSEISQDMYDTAKKIQVAIHEHSVAKRWLVELPGELQKKFLFNTSQFDKPILGYIDKAIVDIAGRRAIIVDLKVMDLKNKYQFARQARRFKYHLQSWIYMTALTQELQAEHKVNFNVDHLYIVVNSKPPHQVMLFKFAASDMDVAAESFYHTLEDIKEKMAYNTWKNLKTETVTLFNNGTDK